jgi:hypothetical protein
MTKIISLVAVAALSITTLSAQAQPPTSSQDRKTYWHVDRPLQAKSDDFLTRMGRVYERDMYHLGQKLDRELPNWRRLPVRDPIPVDENLTAEEVFAANENHAHPLVMYDLSTTRPPKDPGHRSIASTVRYTALAPDRFKGFWKD